MSNERVIIETPWGDFPCELYRAITHSCRGKWGQEPVPSELAQHGLKPDEYDRMRSIMISHVKYGACAAGLAMSVFFAICNVVAYAAEGRSMVAILRPSAGRFSIFVEVLTWSWLVGGNCLLFGIRRIFRMRARSRINTELLESKGMKLVLPLVLGYCDTYITLPVALEDGIEIGAPTDGMELDQSQEVKLVIQETAESNNQHV